MSENKIKKHPFPLAMVRCGAIGYRYNPRNGGKKPAIEEVAALREVIGKDGGIHYPPIVWQSKDGEYHSLAGARRTVAWESMGFADIECAIAREADGVSLTAARWVALGETASGVPIPPPQMADAIRQLLADEEAEARREGREYTQPSQRDIAVRMGMAQTQVSRLLTLRSQLSPELTIEWEAGTVPQEILLQLAKLPLEQQKQALLDYQARLSKERPKKERKPRKPRQPKTDGPATGEDTHAREVTDWMADNLEEMPGRRQVKEAALVMAAYFTDDLEGSFGEGEQKLAEILTDRNAISLYNYLIERVNSADGVF